MEGPDENSSSSTGSSLTHNRARVYAANVLPKDHYQATLLEVFLMGIGIVIGGLTIEWNHGLACGFWGFFIATIIVTVGYLILIHSLAEITSIIAFPGGSYGYVRCSVSPFLGYLVGCCEWIENNFYVMVCVWSNATTITYSLGISNNYEPLWFALQLLVGMAFHSRGGITFWRTMNICAVLTALVIFLYIFAAMTNDTDNFYSSAYSGKSEYTFQGGPNAFFRSLHTPTWFYIGCETSMIAASKINNGTDVIPKAIRLSFFALAIISFWMLFCVKSTQTEDWDSLITTNYPLSYGFAKNLHWDYRLVALLTIPPNMSSILGFLYAAELTTHSMATSGLMPVYLRATVGQNQVPLNALITCVAIQFALLMYFWGYTYHTGDAESSAPVMFQICLLGATLSYVGMLMAYLRFAYRYDSMERKFRSPYGTTGAYVGIFIFSVTFLSIIYSNAGSGGFYLFVTILGVISLYYYFYAEARQCFSQVEQRSFMKAYILNANKKRRLSTRIRLYYDVKYLLVSISECCCYCGCWTLFVSSASSENGTQCCGKVYRSRKSTLMLRNRQYYAQMQRHQQQFDASSQMRRTTFRSSAYSAISSTVSPTLIFQQQKNETVATATTAVATTGTDCTSVASASPHAATLAEKAEREESEAESSVEMIHEPRHDDADRDEKESDVDQHDEEQHSYDGHHHRRHNRHSSISSTTTHHGDSQHSPNTTSATTASVTSSNPPIGSLRQSFFLSISRDISLWFSPFLASNATSHAMKTTVDRIAEDNKNATAPSSNNHHHNSDHARYGASYSNNNNLARVVPCNLSDEEDDSLDRPVSVVSDIQMPTPTPSVVLPPPIYVGTTSHQLNYHHEYHRGHEDQGHHHDDYNEHHYAAPSAKYSLSSPVCSPSNRRQNEQAAAAVTTTNNATTATAVTVLDYV